LTGQAAYVRGINLTTDGSLPLIPPFSATIGARYHIMGSFVAEWNTRYFASQKQIAPGETETEGYMISEASVYSLPKQFGLATFQIFAGVGNIFNKSYVNHLATNRGLVTAEPGRNVFIKIKMNF
jgi:outer membrane receptor protein involved in Fe transport